jgi:hypothetical protein
MTLKERTSKMKKLLSIQAALLAGACGILFWHDVLDTRNYARAAIFLVIFCLGVIIATCNLEARQKDQL